MILADFLRFPEFPVTVLPRCYPAMLKRRRSSGIRSDHQADGRRPQGNRQGIRPLGRRIDRLRCACSATGSKSFVAVYRTGGRNTPLRRVTIGAVGKIEADKAREEAAYHSTSRTWAGPRGGKGQGAGRDDLRQGLRPLSGGRMRHQEGEHARDRQGADRTTYQAAARQEAGRRNQPRPMSRSSCATLPPARPLPTRKTKKRGRAIVEGGKGTATRTVGLLGGIMSFAVSRQLRADNPVRGVKRYADKKGETFLSADELAQSARRWLRQRPTARTLRRLRLSVCWHSPAHARAKSPGCIGRKSTSGAVICGSAIPRPARRSFRSAPRPAKCLRAWQSSKAARSCSRRRAVRAASKASRRSGGRCVSAAAFPASASRPSPQLCVGRSGARRRTDGDRRDPRPCRRQDDQPVCPPCRRSGKTGSRRNLETVHAASIGKKSRRG